MDGLPQQTCFQVIFPNFGSKPKNYPFYLRLDDQHQNKYVYNKIKIITTNITAFSKAAFGFFADCDDYFWTDGVLYLLIGLVREGFREFAKKVPRPLTQLSLRHHCLGTIPSNRVFLRLLADRMSDYIPLLELGYILELESVWELIYLPFYKSFGGSNRRFLEVRQLPHPPVMKWGKNLTFVIWKKRNRKLKLPKLYLFIMAFFFPQLGLATSTANLHGEFFALGIANKLRRRGPISSLINVFRRTTRFVNRFANFRACTITHFSYWSVAFLHNFSRRWLHKCYLTMLLKCLFTHLIKKDY